MNWFKNLIAKIAAKKADGVLGLEEGAAMDTKKWYKSKGVWAGVVSVLLGVYMGVDAQIAPQAGFDLPDIPEWVYVFLGALGVYGRAKADTVITK